MHPTRLSIRSSVPKVHLMHVWQECLRPLRGCRVPVGGAGLGRDPRRRRQKALATS